MINIINEMIDATRSLSKNDPPFEEEEYIQSINMKELSPEVLRALIALYSAQKKLIHINARSNNHILEQLIKYNISNNAITAHLLDEVNLLKDKNTSKLFTVKNLSIGFGVILVIMLIIWIMYIFDKDATTYIMSLLGEGWKHIGKFLLNKIGGM